MVVSAFGYSAQALSLVAIPLYLTTIGAEGYGLIVTVMALMGYLGFADAGLSWGSMILIAQAHGRDGRREIAHIVRHSAVLAAGSGLIVALAVGAVLIAAGAGWRLPMFVKHPEADRLILIAGIQLGLNLQFGVFYNVFQGLQESYWAGVYQGLARLLGLGGAMLAAWYTRSVEAVMLVQLGMTALSGVAAAIHARHRHPWAFAPGSWSDATQYRAQLRIGGKNFLLQIGRTLSGTAPTLGISSIIGPAAVPFYTVPTTLLSLFYTPINTWSASMQSAYGEAWVSGDHGWVRDAFKRSLERALIFGGLGLALFLSLGDSFIRIWTHQRLSLDAAMAASVTGIVLTATLLSAGQFLLTGLNRHGRAAVAEIANGSLALVMVVLAVRSLGLGAVGIGVVGAAMITSAWVLRREIAAQLGPGSFPGIRFVLKVCVATAAATVAAKFIQFGASGDGLRTVLQLLVAGCAGGAVYFGTALGFRLVAFGEAAAFGWKLRERVFAARP